MPKMPIAEKAATEVHDPDANCRALGQLLDRVGDKWTIMAVGALSQGPLRFNALMRRAGGVSHRMLTLTLGGWSVTAWSGGRPSPPSRPAWTTN
jgi:hypothetical protein